MGLASKLAAMSGQQQPAYAPPPNFGPPGGQPPRPGGGYPAQQQYPGPQQGFQPQQQAFQPGGPAQIQAYKNSLYQTIQENRLQAFYPPNSPALDILANKAAHQLPALAHRWHIPMEIANDLVKLGLYDVILFIDDSGSMAFEEGGERIKDLRLVLERVASVATVFDEDGVSIRFMNSNYDMSLLENVQTEQQIERLMGSVQFKGLTPMGTELRRKVIEGIVLPKLQRRQYTKPHLVIVITDGQPAGEAPTAVSDTLRFAAQEVGRAMGPGAIAFQFAQVGNDLKARDFLAKLDEDPTFGGMVDCTSNYENESDEMRRKGADLTPDLWLVKLILGAIDRSYDSKDEGPPVPAGGQFGYQR